MSTYGDDVILETLAEHVQHGILVVLLDDPGGSREDAVGGLAQARIGGLTGLEQNTEELRPLIACNKLIRTVSPRDDNHSRIPLSVYCLAISATESPTFLRTSATDSVVRHVTSFCRITSRCSPVRVEKSSLASLVTGSLRVLVAILLNSTAAKDLIWRRSIRNEPQKSTHTRPPPFPPIQSSPLSHTLSLYHSPKESSAFTPKRHKTYTRFSALNLLHQAHKQHIRTILNPIIIQLFLSLRADRIIAGHQPVQQL